MPFLNKKRSFGYSWEPTLTMKLSALLVLIAALIICWKVGTKGEYQSANSIPSTTEEFAKQFPNLSLSEADTNISTDEAKEIHLSDYHDQLTIMEAGSYILDGNLEGQIVIDAKEETIHLLLDGVSVEAKKGPALVIEAANKVTITLLEGSENTFADSSNYTSKDYESCIYSNCNLTFNGTGKLDVSGLYKDAIRTKDILKIADGTYRVHSKRTGLRGNDGILIAGGNLFIGSEKYGLKTTKTGAEDRGNLVVSGGTLSMVAGEYGFVAEKSNVYIFDCEIHMNSIVNDFNVKGSKVIRDGCIQ